MPKVTQSHRENAYDVEQSQYLEPQPSNWSQQARQWLKGGVMLMGGLTLGGLALTAGRGLLRNKREDLQVVGEKEGLIATGMSRSLLSIENANKEDDSSRLQEADYLVKNQELVPMERRAVSAEIKVSDISMINDLQGHPDVAVLANGNYVITWRSGTSTNYDVYWKGYSSAGNEPTKIERVNTITTASQYLPRIAALPYNRFVIVWKSDQLQNPQIYRKMYRSDGMQLEDDVAVLTKLEVKEDNPAVAAFGDYFTVTWQNFYPDKTYAICCRHYNEKDGSGYGPERFYPDSSGNDTSITVADPDIAYLSNGDFVVVWTRSSSTRNDIYGSIFENGASTPKVSHFKINTFTATNQGVAAVARLNNGFIVVWNIRAQIGSGDIPFGRRYELQGSTLVPIDNEEFHIPTQIYFAQKDTPKVASLTGGGFVVTWEYLGGNDGVSSKDNDDIGARRYDASGKAIGDQFRVNMDNTIGTQSQAVVASLSDGGFVVTWSSYSHNADYDFNYIYKKQYSHTAPILTAKSPKLTPTNEDTTNPAGNTISSIIQLGAIVDFCGDSREAIAITAVTGTDIGNWQYSVNNGNSWSNITASASQSLLLYGEQEVRFVPNTNKPDAYPNPTFTFKAWDRTTGTSGHTFDTRSNPAFSSATDTASITITPVNDAPVLQTEHPELKPIDEDEPDASNSGETVAKIIVPGSITDPDGPAVYAMAIIERANQGIGNWQYKLDGENNWQNITLPSSDFGLLLDSADRARFHPNPNCHGNATFDFVAWDESPPGQEQHGQKVSIPNPRGGKTAFSVNTNTVTITVRSINDAPILDEDAHPTLTPIIVAYNLVSANIGNNVTEIIVPGSITDPDGPAVYAMAIIERANQGGNWQYKLEGVNSWENITLPSSDSGLLLDSADRVRFNPNPNCNGETSFIFRAWDESDPGKDEHGNTFRITTSVTSAFSSATNKATISYKWINDAPVLSPAQPVLDPIHEDIKAEDNKGEKVSKIVAGLISDVDGPSRDSIAIIEVDNKNGAWQYAFDQEAVWNQIAPVNERSSLLLDGEDKVRFDPKSNFYGNAAFTFRAWDESNPGKDKHGQSNTTANGGSSAFSKETDVATITVTTVNDPPVIVNNQFVMKQFEYEITLTEDNLSATDIDNDDATLKFTMKDIHGGWFKVDGKKEETDAHFEQEKIKQGKVKLARQYGGCPSFKITVSDGIATVDKQANTKCLEYIPQQFVNWVIGGCVTGTVSGVMGLVFFGIKRYLEQKADKLFDKSARASRRITHDDEQSEKFNQEVLKPITDEIRSQIKITGVMGNISEQKTQEYTKAVLVLIKELEAAQVDTLLPELSPNDRDKLIINIVKIIREELVPKRACAGAVRFFRTELEPKVLTEHAAEIAAKIAESMKQGDNLELKDPTSRPGEVIVENDLEAPLLAQG